MRIWFLTPLLCRYFLSNYQNSLESICNFIANELLYLCNVKWTPFILCMYILALSVTPCTDGSNEECKEQVEHHDHSEDEDDGCTPFCSCSCCGSLFTFSDSATYLSFNIKISEKVDSYSTHYFGSYLEEIWHPPAV